MESVRFVGMDVHQGFLVRQNRLTAGRTAGPIAACRSCLKARYPAIDGRDLIGDSLTRVCEPSEARNDGHGACDTDDEYGGDDGDPLGCHDHSPSVGALPTGHVGSMRTTDLRLLLGSIGLLLLTPSTCMVSRTIEPTQRTPLPEALPSMPT